VNKNNARHRKGETHKIFYVETQIGKKSRGRGEDSTIISSYRNYKEFVGMSPS